MADQLPPPPVQTYPVGLLSFLGVKNGGQNPSPLLPGLQTVMDPTRFYIDLAGDTRGNDLIAVPLGGGQTRSTFNVVPAGKVWIVTNFVAIFPAAPATPYQFPNIAIQDATGYDRRYWPINSIRYVAGDRAVITSNDWFFMDSGWAFAAGWWVAASAGGNVNLEVTRIEFNR